MKKLTIGLGLLLSGLASTAWAAYPTGTSACDVNVPSYCGGFTFGVSGLYWRPSSSHRQYGATVLDEDIGDIGQDDFSILSRTRPHAIDPNFDWGFRVNAGYIFPCSGNDIKLTYTHFNSSDNDTVAEFPLPSLAAIDLLQNDPFFGPTLAFTNESTPVVLVLPVNAIFDSAFFDTTSVSGSLSASSLFKNQTWDLDFGQAINVGCHFNFRLFGGLRYSKVQHDLNTTSEISATGTLPVPGTGEGGLIFENITVGVLEDPTSFFDSNIVQESFLLFNNGDSTTLTLAVEVEDILHRKSRFEGWGPRIGFDLNYQLCGGFGFVGSVATSLLVGHVNNEVNEHLIGSGTFEDSENIVGFDVNLNTINFQNSFFNSVDDIITIHHPEETRVVPNIDLKLGVDYTYQFCNCSHTRLTVEAGYEVSHFFNAIDKFEINDVSNQGKTLDVSFDGPYVSVQVAF
jgi:hypothetical protein